MLPTEFLKKYFPNAPDWLLGGLFFVFALWLVVLPLETFEIVIRKEYIPAHFSGWLIKFLYIWGYAISLYLISPLVDYSSLSDQLGGAIIVLFGLFICSPVYFTIGALFATKKDATLVLGIVLTVLNIMVSCLVTLWLIIFLYSG